MQVRSRDFELTAYTQKLYVHCEHPTLVSTISSATSNVSVNVLQSSITVPTTRGGELLVSGVETWCILTDLPSSSYAATELGHYDLYAAIQCAQAILRQFIAPPITVHSFEAGLYRSRHWQAAFREVYGCSRPCRGMHALIRLLLAANLISVCRRSLLPFSCMSSASEYLRPCQ